MKTVCFILGLLIVNCLWAQGKIPKNRQYEYSTKTIDYYFYLNSETKQSISWGNIYGHERCYAHVINNSGDSLLIQRVGSRNDPLHWFLDGTSRRDLILPNDTIHLRAKWARRHGPITRSITLQYRSSSNLSIQHFSVTTRGMFIDSNEIKRQQARKVEKEKQEQKEFLKDHFENGQIRQVINKNPKHDSIPVKTTYYPSGIVRLKEYRRTGIVKEAFDKTGYLRNTWDDKGIRTEYYPNGNPKFKSGKDRYSAEDPYLTFYYENGCLQKEVFLNESIIKRYDSLNCNQLLLKTVKDSTIYHNTIAYYADGKIARIKYLSSIGGRHYAEHVGTFNGYRLTDGFVNYYSGYNKLLFSSQIIAGKRDAVLSKQEKQGDQINLIDEAGRRTGLWIMQKSNDTVPISISSNLQKPISDFRNIAWRNYIYDKGDTLSLVYFHDYGGISGYSYIRDREKRIQRGDEIGMQYYQNGYLKTKSYELKNGVHVIINYSETEENKITDGRKSYYNIYSKLIYDNNKLVEIKSEYRLPKLDIDDSYSRSPKKLKDGMSVEKKGKFKRFELYNGFIRYYDKHKNLTRTEKVVNGVIQGNPRVNLREKKLFDAAIRNDLNMNHWVEQRELNGLTSISIRLTEEEVKAFNWAELSHFKNLEVLNCNQRSYRVSAYKDYSALKSAVINKAGAKVTPKPHRYSWEPPEPDFDFEEVVPEIIPPKPIVGKIVEFPDIAAKFPGGQVALQKWLQENIIRPKVDTDGRQYRVFVEFIVLRDGSIINVKVIKGVQLEFDREAKRVVGAMPNWEPAISQGEICNSRVRLPISFGLE